MENEAPGLTKKLARLPRFDSIKQTLRSLTKYDIIVPLWPTLNKRVHQHIEQDERMKTASNTVKTAESRFRDSWEGRTEAARGPFTSYDSTRWKGVGCRERREGRNNERKNTRGNTLSVTQQERQTFTRRRGYSRTSTLLLPSNGGMLFFFFFFFYRRRKFWLNSTADCTRLCEPTRGYSGTDQVLQMLHAGVKWLKGRLLYSRGVKWKGGKCGSSFSYDWGRRLFGIFCTWNDMINTRRLTQD